MEHNVWFMVFSGLSFVGGSGFGMLLGPERTSVGWVFFLAASGLGRLTPSCGGGGGLLGFGVWLCVECCIVDASILL